MILNQSLWATSSCYWHPFDVIAICFYLALTILCPFQQYFQPGTQNGSCQTNLCSLSESLVPIGRWLSSSWAWRLVGWPPESPPPQRILFPPRALGGVGAPTLMTDRWAVEVGLEDPIPCPCAGSPKGQTLVTMTRCCLVTEEWWPGLAGSAGCCRLLTLLCWGIQGVQAQWES